MYVCMYSDTGLYFVCRQKEFESSFWMYMAYIGRLMEGDF